MFNKLRLLTPGPTPLPETVRLALARDMIHHRKAEFQEIMRGTQKKLQELFGTVNQVLPLASSGTGAMTAAAGNLFAPGEEVLIVEAGKFGERWKEIALSCGLVPHVMAVEWGEAVSAEKIEAALIEKPEIRGLFVQLCETSTGVLMPIEKIGKICSKRNVLLIVDGISAVGISPCPMDEWNIDCLLTGSQKGLMLPPGLALISLSEKAWDKADSIKPACFYFDLKAERKNIAKGQTHFTTPVNLIFGLQASLKLLLSEGLEEIYRHQWALTMLVRNGASAMGLKLFVQKNFAWGLTSICLPENISGSALLAHMQENYGVCIAGGQDILKNRIVRFGHMGWVDWGDCISGLTALAEALSALSSFAPEKGWLEKAMEAYTGAMNQAPAAFMNEE